MVGFAADRPVKLNLEVALFIPTKYSRVLVFASKGLTMVTYLDCKVYITTPGIMLSKRWLKL